MSNVQQEAVSSILEMTDTQCDILIEKVLKQFDPQIDMRVNYIMNANDIKKNQALEYIVTIDPVLWAKIYLNWEARIYQAPMLHEMKKSRRVVLRLGRRLGKTDTMCVAILWFAYTQFNKGPNPQYDIVIATPYVNQIDLIFNRLHQLIKMSPIISGSITRDIEHRIELTINGLVVKILGFTAGANSGDSGSNSVRGQRADVIILDEVDYMGTKQIANLMQLVNERPDEVKVIAASTPCGKHEDYYKWCTGASKEYYPSEEDIRNNTFTGYKIKTREGKRGNGWIQIYAPSNVNKEVLKINPDTNQTYLEDMRDEYSEMTFAQEVMAEFGEENVGVYQKKFIEWARDEGLRSGHKYITTWNADDKINYLRKTQGHNVRCLGIDWDKYGAATHMVCVEYDRYYEDENGHIGPIFKVLFHEEIPRGEFTYDHALNKIIALNEEYKFDWIAIDKGYGEVQLELLRKYGMQHPKSGLAQKVEAYQFSQNIEIIDPITRKKNNTMMKPYMVNNSVNLFEKHKVVLDPDDKYLIQQLEEYRVISISSMGKPIYSSENEHALDAMNLALLIFAQHNDFLLRKIYSSKIGTVKNPLDARTGDIDSRGINDEDDELEMLSQSLLKSVNNNPFSSNHTVIGVSPVAKSTRHSKSRAFTRELW